MGADVMAYMTTLTHLDLRCGHGSPVCLHAGQMPSPHGAARPQKLAHRLTLLSSSACSNTRSGDGYWPALAQLPQLKWLDLSGSRLTLGSLSEGVTTQARVHLL